MGPHQLYRILLGFYGGNRTCCYCEKEFDYRDEAMSLAFFGYSKHLRLFWRNRTKSLINPFSHHMFKNFFLNWTKTTKFVVTASLIFFIHLKQYYGNPSVAFGICKVWCTVQNELFIAIDLRQMKVVQWNLREKIKPVVIEKEEFDYWDKSFLMALLVYFGLMRFWCRNQKEWIVSRCLATTETLSFGTWRKISFCSYWEI